MTEHPIIFSGEMVRAILEGRKTQTRRTIRLRKLFGEEKRNPDDVCNVSDFSKAPPSIYSEYGFYFDLGDDIVIYQCPYGNIGDHLWVREKFSISGNGYFYATDVDGMVKVAWSSPIHMPRQASRITLEIVNVRVEQLQQITDDDAIAEGVDLSINIGTQKKMGKAWAKVRFEQGWNRLNAKRGFSWASNPWVWVIEFKRVDQ